MKVHDLPKIPNSKTMAEDYSSGLISKRVEFIKHYTGVELSHVPRVSFDATNMKGNIENLIGCAQVPIGIAGPLRINGEHANGDFYVPLATTEGVLITGLTNGARLLTQAGGIKTKVLSDQMHITPLFLIDGLDNMKLFVDWINENIDIIKNIVKMVTKHGELLSLEPKMTGEGVLLKMSFFTKDASGLNMIVASAFQICNYICYQRKIKFYLRVNYSSDKKNSAHNFVSGYGKEVFAESIISQELLDKKGLAVSVADLNDYCKIATTCSVHAGIIGMNCQVANVITGIFIACGQDVAQTVHSTSAIFSVRLLDKGDLYLSLYIPNLIVGTIGGGTGLPTQRECLEIMGCYGQDKSLKFAEIIAGAALAGEIALGISLATLKHVEMHERLGRNKPE